MRDKKRIIFFVLIAISSLYIFLTGPFFIQNIPYVMIQIFGVLLISWAYLSRKMSEHKAEHLKEGLFLVMHGPYEIIRHPIYAGFLLIMSSFVQGFPSVLRLIAFLILLGASLLKLTYEEGILEGHEKKYAEYKAKTHRLIPYLF